MKGVDKAPEPKARLGTTRDSVRAYISALAPGHRKIAQRFDTLVRKTIPGVQRVIKWHLPFYGRKGGGWFVSCGVIRGEVRITFFQGRNLRPVPPEGSGQLRGIGVSSPGAFDTKRLGSWVRQAAKLSGFGS